MVYCDILLLLEQSMILIHLCKSYYLLSKYICYVYLIWLAKGQSDLELDSSIPIIIILAVATILVLL